MTASIRNSESKVSDQSFKLSTPRTLRESTLRLATGSQRMLPRNLSQDDFYGMEFAHMAIARGNNHWSQRHQANAVIHPVSGKEMEYKGLMKDPRLQPLWTRGFGNECGCLFQGISDIPGTDTCLFIELKKHPKTERSNMAQLSAITNHTKRKRNAFLTVGGDILDYREDVVTSTAD
jgi:hypothetical protein